MIAARQIAFGGSAKKIPSAIEYSLGGKLATQWDGIENVAYGVSHSYNATQWIDLVEGKVAGLQTGAYFDERSCVLPKTNAIYDGALFNSEWDGVTVQFAYRGGDLTNQVYPALLCSANDMYSFYWTNRVEGGWRVKWAHNTMRAATSGNATLFGEGLITFRLNKNKIAYGRELLGFLRVNGMEFSGGRYTMTNGNEIWNIGGNNTRYLGTNAQICAIRIYKEELTEDEILFTEQLDQARFGITI